MSFFSRAKTDFSVPLANALGWLGLGAFPETGGYSIMPIGTDKIGQHPFVHICGLRDNKITMHLSYSGKQRALASLLPLPPSVFIFEGHIGKEGDGRRLHVDMLWMWGDRGRTENDMREAFTAMKRGRDTGEAPTRLFCSPMTEAKKAGYSRAANAAVPG